MSAYAFNPQLGELIVTWSLPVGMQAASVARVHALADDFSMVEEIAEALTQLSAAIWNTYSSPADSALGSRTAEVQEAERAALDSVVGAIVEPNRPDENGTLVVSYSPVTEAAHHLGRLLWGFAIPEVTRCVVADVETELDAVRRAWLGDISGRGVQATALDKVDASPNQVVVIGRQIAEAPLDWAFGATAVEPAAAAVALVPYLVAAAGFAAKATGAIPEDVFAEADAIEAGSVEVPALVVKQAREGHTPQHIVHSLLSEAVALTRGVIVDLPALLARHRQIEQTVDLLPQEQRAAAMADEPVRATLLDPRRPARDLVEHLVAGLHACEVVCAERLLGGEGELDDFAGDELLRRDLRNQLNEILRQAVAGSS